MSDNIIAQCTPRGSGALALLRMSGKQTYAIADQFCVLASNKKISDCQSHTIHYGSIVDQANTIDQVLFFIMKAPQTFTGEDTLEITCHNNPFIIDLIIQKATQCGARLALPGEFSQQAVANNKIDVLQAEAIHELVQSNNSRSLQFALAQLQGSLSSWIDAIEKELSQCLCLAQASFEFLDDEAEFAPLIREKIHNILIKIEQLCSTFESQKHLREGFRIALLGTTNVGKSSLFNLLIGTNRAIVTPIAGTTRDTLEAGLYKNGTYWTIIDTAGLRETTDIIELEGIERSLQEAAKSDILLLVLDSSRAMTHSEQILHQELITKYHQKIIIITNKIDLESTELQTSISSSTVRISAKNQEHTHILENAITEQINRIVQQHIPTPFLLNGRHMGVVSQLKNDLQKLLVMCNQQKIAYELICHDIIGILTLMNDLTGKSISENAMDQIFRQFCIGK